MQHDHPVVHDVPPSAEAARRPFLARPFWRDYVVAYVLIGAGLVLGDVGITERSPQRWLLLVPAIASLTAGCGVLLSAIRHAIRSRLRGGAERVASG